MSNTYKLQLRHGAEGKNFSTREDVFNYINGQLNYGGVSLLPYEPVLFFYGDEDAKNTIMIFGLPENTSNNGRPYFAIDTANLQSELDGVGNKYDEEFNSLSEKDAELEEAIEKETTERIAADKEEASARSEKDAELEETIVDEAKKREDKDIELENSIEFTKDDIQSIIEACGLIYNDKLSNNRVSYSADIQDDIIRGSQNISEAVDKVSKFAAKIANELKISVANTDTVSLELADGDGKVLSANVNIAGTNGLSKRTFDNNILGKTSEGLYVSASIEPSPTNPNILIFRTSGYVDGEFKVDAYETEVPLASYSGDTGKDTGIAVTVNQEKNIISAELNLASDVNNMLELRDGEYIVNGKAKLIKYKDTTVFDALNSQSKDIETLKADIEDVKEGDINGSETSTSKVTVEKNSRGDITIYNDVKLNDDKSIIVSDGGLKANITAAFVEGTSTLVIKVGNNSYNIDLSALAVSVLDGVSYDSDTETLTLVFTVGTTTKSVNIPIGKLIHDTEVDDTDTVDMTLTSVSGGPNRISANVRISTLASNILEASSSGLYVSKAHITDAVNTEADVRKAADEKINTKISELSDIVYANEDNIEKALNEVAAAKIAIDKEITRATDAEKANAAEIANNKTAISENAKAISDEVTRAKAAEVANSTAIENETTKRAAAIDSINSTITSLADTLKHADDDLLEKISENTNSISEVKTNVDNEVSRAKDAEVELEKQIIANKSAIATEEARATAAEEKIKADFQTTVEAATSAKTLADELNLKLTDEISRATAADEANATAIVTERERAEKAEEELKADVTTIQTNVSSVIDKLNPTIINVETISTDLANEIKRAETAEKNNADAILAESERAKNAEKVNSDAITEEGAARENAINILKTELSTSIDKKADSADVYTKDEVLERLSEYAKVTETQSKLDEKINTAVANATFAAKDVVDKIENTYATREYVNNADENINAAIKSNTNAINNIEITYNSSSNVLTYVDKNGKVQVFNLYSGSLVEEGRFDTISNSIILTVTEPSGTKKEITIPVSELLTEVSKDIQTNASDIAKINEDIDKLANSWDAISSNTVELTKTTAGEKDSLTASVKIASGTNQAIRKEGSGLFVSSNLDDYICVFGEEGTISGQSAISKLLKRTNDNANELETIKLKVSTIESEITRVSEEIKSLNTTVENMSERIDILEETYGEIILQDINDIKTNLIGTKDDPVEGSVWDELNHMVDGGEYYGEDIIEDTETE